MSKEKEEGKYFTSLYETLYKFNTNPIEAAGSKGGKYGQAIMEAVGSGETLARLNKDQQIYMLEVMKNILYPKSRDQDEEGGSIPNLEFLKVKTIDGGLAVTTEPMGESSETHTVDENQTQ